MQPLIDYFQKCLPLKNEETERVAVRGNTAENQALADDFEAPFWLQLLICGGKTDTITK